MEGADPRRWRALLACLVAVFMTLLNVSIVNVALPSIKTALHASDPQLQWIVASYAISYGLVLVPLGRLGDVYGKRRLFVLGTIVFALGSVLAGASLSASALIAARLTQGVGAGILNPQIIGLIQVMFSGKERGMAFGLRGSTIGVSTAIGPVIGGLIINLFDGPSGWRWIFFLNVPISTITIYFALRFLYERRASVDARPSIDPLGVALLGTGLFCVLFGIIETEYWYAPAALGICVVGILMLYLFYRWERVYSSLGRDPLLDTELLANRSFRIGLAVATSYFAGFTGVVFVLTLYLQSALGFSALEAGLAVTPFAVGSATTAAMSGRFVDTMGRRLVVLGLSTVVVGLVLAMVAVSVVGDHQVVGFWLIGPLLLGGLGSGLVVSPNQTLTLAHVALGRAAAAGGALTTGQRVGTALGIAVPGSVYFGFLSSEHSWLAAGLGLGACAVVTTISLLIALGDMVLGRRSERR